MVDFQQPELRRGDTPDPVAAEKQGSREGNGGGAVTPKHKARPWEQEIRLETNGASEAPGGGPRSLHST